MISPGTTNTIPGMNQDMAQFDRAMAQFDRGIAQSKQYDQGISKKFSQITLTNKPDSSSPYSAQQTSVKPPAFYSNKNGINLTIGQVHGDIIAGKESVEINYYS